MKKWMIYLLLALALCLCACGKSAADPDPDDLTGDDWRTTGIVRSSGTITRDGQDTFVLVTVGNGDAAFYYDTEEQTLCDHVTYPELLQGDPWAMFRSIDFADRNGDGSSDVAMLFDQDGETILLVWFWDTQSEAFLFQPEESQLSRST